MYDLIQQLGVTEQRQLLRLLDPTAELDELADDEIPAELRKTLREVLQVPEEGDLREYLRRRLVEVANKDFGLGKSFDDASDLELAEQLVEFALDAAAKLSKSKKDREQFSTFLKTKDARERHRWLVASKRLGALLDEGVFDRAARERAAEHANEVGRSPDAFRATAKEMVDDLGRATLASAATRRALAGAPPALALPLSAVAGGLFMAGASKARLSKDIGKEAAKERARRARRSKMVQKLMGLCAFMVIARGERP